MSEDLLTLEEFMNLVDTKELVDLKAEIVTKAGTHYLAEFKNDKDSHRVTLILM